MATDWQAVVAAGAALAGLAGVVPPATARIPPDCPPVAGVERLLEAADVVLVGEIHGTEQSPTFVAALACHAVRAGHGVTVGFELAESETDRFAAFLASDGSTAARAALLAGPPWQAEGQGQYGATSQAMVGLLESLRRLRRQGHPVGFALFNRVGRDSQERDREMARALGAEVRSVGADRFIALTGNIHSRLARGTPWAPEYEPMGFLLHRAEPELRLISLDVAHAGGSAWLCTPEGCGERPLGARGETAAEPFAIELHDEIQADGHHGRYFVGAIQASPPAVTKER